MAGANSRAYWAKELNMSCEETLSKETEDRIKTAVEENVAKQLAQVAQASGLQGNSDSTRGGGKYHFLPKGMTSCLLTFILHLWAGGNVSETSKELISKCAEPCTSGGG